MAASRAPSVILLQLSAAAAWVRRHSRGGEEQSSVTQVALASAGKRASVSGASACSHGPESGKGCASGPFSQEMVLGPAGGQCSHACAARRGEACPLARQEHTARVPAWRARGIGCADGPGVWRAARSQCRSWLQHARSSASWVVSVHVVVALGGTLGALRAVVGRVAVSIAGVAYWRGRRIEHGKAQQQVRVD